MFYLYDSECDEISQVIKISRFHSACTDPNLSPRVERFRREIAALDKAREEGQNAHVIQITSHDTISLEGKDYRYYTMERADRDLARFLREHDITQQQRFLICADMIKCIRSLHEMGIYHRDIKPANFLMIGSNWKIADLGLIDSREEDLAATDGERERIGPRGFLSPEAVNKWLGLVDPPRIDDRSDVFQLAMVMAFVLQGEVISGQVSAEDFKPAEDAAPLCDIMSRALQFCKNRRWKVEELLYAFLDSFGEKYALA